MKSPFFSARMVLNNCPFAFFRIGVVMIRLTIFTWPRYFMKRVAQ
ncbi:hypothetical protein TELCIR_25190 [Teladorsagia circumcincta]|uniref:Uncharacterized protein n=1 Tax=Teladorsagia circumcincta TaxID=45464 RepID=A0A2G9T699_TELCI|nr:hypothetical protein TELCIR_25190 [Teladorsagia circumcincta]